MCLSLDTICLLIEQDTMPINVNSNIIIFFIRIYF